MICGVGVYAIVGALVMKKLETRTIAEIRPDNEKHQAAGNVEVMKHQRHQENDTKNMMNIIEEIEKSEWLERKRRAAAEVTRSRKCVISVFKRHRFNECKNEKFDEDLIKELDQCYRISIEHETHTNDLIFRNSEESVETVAEEYEEIKPWSFVDSLLFAFTVITTIGYGNVAPRTFSGRLFVIVYGFIGIPFTLLAIADLGKFLSEIMMKGSKAEEKADEMTEFEDDEEDSQAIPLFISFIIYIILGGVMLATYEPDMDFFKAVYFNFVTLTSIGLGDIVPRSETYMALTIIYIAVGLALTTIAVDIAADTLKKLHYFGRKIENVGNVAIWFGGKKITMKALVRNLGDQFNLPTTTVKNLDLDHFVDQAIKVEEGEIETLRPPAFEPDTESLDGTLFVDESYQEVWKSDSTPSPSPSPEPQPSIPPFLDRRKSISTKSNSPTPDEPSPVPSPPILHSPSSGNTNAPTPPPAVLDERNFHDPTPPRSPTPSSRQPTPPPLEPTPPPLEPIPPLHNPSPEPEPVIEAVTMIEEPKPVNVIVKILFAENLIANIAGGTLVLKT
ncbi:Ion channel [Dictyocaulus viviparus]|uniref:Ion channel n=1 Tax=Dictyocaulus viviparus TaxID=29172 RepID=A0A0D8XVI4_DICVI|nr:Ion channel [Dictyocaulus viviparus]